MKISVAAKELLETGKLDLYGEIFEITSLEKIKNDEDKKFYYECSLNKKGRTVVYGHINKATTKLEAITLALEGMEMMGWEFD